MSATLFDIALNMVLKGTVWVFINMCTCIYCFCIASFMYIYYYLLLVQGLLPPCENSIEVSNNNKKRKNTYNQQKSALS